MKMPGIDPGLHAHTHTHIHKNTYTHIYHIHPYTIVYTNDPSTWEVSAKNQEFKVILRDTGSQEARLRDI